MFNVTALSLPVLTGLFVVAAVYLFGLIFRPDRRVLGTGVDSLAVLLLCLVGLLGLVAIAGGQG